MANALPENALFVCFGGMSNVGTLIEKGASVGTALAFMMAVVGLSLPEMVILRRVLKPRLIAVFIGVLALAIMLTRYLFNLIL
jgi:uncharacterized protein